MTPPEYKKLRESLGTQAEVARILGVNRVTIAKRESGAMKLTWEACLAMGAIATLRRPKRSRKSENVKAEAPSLSEVDPPAAG
jgi:DNA-binding XRE family transcriptional regulator